MLIAETADFHQHQLGQLAGEITDMDARAAINVRRILIREKENLRHWSGLHFEQQHRHIHFMANFIGRRAVKDVTD